MMGYNKHPRLCRILAAALALMLMLSLLSCSYSPIAPSEEDLRVVGTVGEYEVYLEELRYVALSYYSMILTRYGDDAFTGEDKEARIEELYELVYRNITANYATLELCHEAEIERGSAAIEARVDEYMNGLFDEIGSMKGYKEYLAENNATDHLLRFSIEISLLQNELLFAYTDSLGIIEDDESMLMEIIADEFIAVRHVFIPHTNPDAYELICSAKERIDAGESFDAVMGALDEDPDMDENGIFILRGYMSEEYENAAFKLRTGRCSDIVSDYNGYYVITRDKFDMSHVWLNFDRLKQLWQTYTFFGMVDDRQKQLEFVPNEAAEQLMRAVIAGEIA